MSRSTSRRLLGLASSIAAVAVLVVPVAASAGFPTPPINYTAKNALQVAAPYPQQNVLPVWPDNPADGSAAIGDIPYDEIAPS